MEQTTELLVTTIAHIQAGRDADILAQMQFIKDTIQRAPGLVAFHTYRSREPRTAYLITSIWESYESWRIENERHDLQMLLLTRPDLLTKPPEQWYMHYCWGYRRPARPQTLSTMYIAQMPPEVLPAIRQAYLHEIRQQAAQFVFSGGFLAQGRDEFTRQRSTNAEPTETSPIQQDNTLLINISWSSENEQVTFTNGEGYQRLANILGRQSTIQMLTLDPL